jgi:hypothetical protein
MEEFQVGKEIGSREREATRERNAGCEAVFTQFTCPSHSLQSVGIRSACSDVLLKLGFMKVMC